MEGLNTSLRSRVSVAAAAIAVACLGGLALAVEDGAAAIRRSGDVVAWVSAPPGTAPAGSAFSVRDTTRYLGGRPRRAWTVYLASRRPGPAAGQILLGARRVQGLRPGRVSRASVTVRIPLRARTGVYWLIACAAGRPRRKDVDRTSCTVARRRIRIVPAAPRSAGAPRITGRARDAQVLRASAGRWTGLAPIAYTRQWRRCDRAGRRCANVAGATAASYTVSPADVGRTIRLIVTAANAHGRRAAQSPPTARVQPAPPANRRAPTVAGRALAGQTVTASAGRWIGTPPLLTTYQWQRCGASRRCADIPGATTPSHTLAAAEVGPALRVVVKSRNRAGTAVARSAAVPTGIFQNPVFADAPSPDPFVLDDGGAHASYWEFNTGNLFPIRHSTDLIHWTPAGSAFTSRPAWATNAGDWHPWGPSVLRVESACPGAEAGPCYVMYYVSLSRQWGVNCVGVATATTPGGPYTDLGPLQLTLAEPSAEPVGCGDATGQGNIDPSPFVDDNGNAYLYVSTDSATTGGVSRLQPTISVLPLSDDRLQASGPRSALFSGDPGTWEAADTSVPKVEGPAMVKHNGTYYLMYSGGGWRAAYGMGYAVSSNPVFGFEKAGRLLTEAPPVLSTGGADALVTGSNGGTWLVYHGRDVAYSNPRTLRIDRISWRPGSPDVPVVAGPTSAPVPEVP